MRLFSADFGQRPGAQAPRTNGRPTTDAQQGPEVGQPTALAATADRATGAQPRPRTSLVTELSAQLGRPRPGHGSASNCSMLH
eukprot:3322653-Alexandrium_andersonii.AAC.1